jgi:hypothetical protein
MLTAIFLSAFINTQAETAYSRANLTAYQATPPNSWEPKGYNVNGSAPWLVVNTVGWNAVKLMGNVGLGDGSVSYLNATSNRDHNYTDSYIMAADVSMAPMDMGRVSNFLSTIGAPEAGNISTAQNNIAGNNSTSLNGLAGATAEEGTGVVNAGTNIALDDPYHKILLGRPVDDMMYQYPLTPTISAYGRLVGLPLPGGSLANIGIRSLSYGY